MPRTRQEVVLDEDVVRVDRVVQTMTGASRSGVRGMFDHGCVTVNGATCREAGMPAPRGAVVVVDIVQGRRYRELPPTRPNSAFRIHYEDGRLIVVEKPAGILTIPTFRGERDTLVDAVARHFSRGRVPQPAFVVHRLDRDTSGLLVFARTEAIAETLQRQFAARKPEREYAAIVAGQVAEDAGTYESYLAANEELDEVSSDDPRDGKHAVTHFEVVERLRGATFVRVHLETGRRNQIRVHFADTGHPVLGDTRYATELARHPDWREHRLALHARTLGFVHPVTGRAVRVTSELPPAFEAFLAAARRQAK